MEEIVKTVEKMKYSYSLCEDEPFIGIYDSVDDAIGAAEDDLDCEGDDAGNEIFICQAIPAADLLKARDIGEGVIEMVDMHLSQFIDNDGQEIICLAPEHKKILGEIVVAYLKGHADFLVFRVGKVEKHLRISHSSE